MTDVDIGFMVAASVVTLLSLRLPRGLLLVGVGAASYLLSAAAWRMNWPYVSFVTGMCDAAVCFAVYFGGKQRWELWVWRIYQVSVAASLIYLASSLRIFSSIPHDIYSLVLEACNWAVLLVIGGTAILQLIGADDDVGVTRAWGGVRRFNHFARQKRARHFLSKKVE